MSLNKNTGILIDRAINELRTGRPIVLQDNGKYWIFYNIEHIFNSTYRTGNIVISSHSIYSDQKYWKRLRKDNEIDFWTSSGDINILLLI